MITLCEEKDTFYALFAGAPILKKSSCGHCLFLFSTVESKSCSILILRWTIPLILQQISESLSRASNRWTKWSAIITCISFNAVTQRPLWKLAHFFHGVISHSSIRLSLYVYNRALNLYFTSSRLHHLLSVTMLSSIHHAEHFTQDAAKCDRSVFDIKLLLSATLYLLKVMC